MSPHHRLLDSVRNTKKTLYVVTAFYVFVGFMLAIFAVANGDRLGTFLGFVIISGALATAALFRSVMGVGLRISTMGEHLDEARQRLRRIEVSVSARSPVAGERGGEAGTEGECVDLAEAAPGDASLITAATLDRAAYPRLVAGMAQKPPAQTQTDRDRVATVESPDAGADGLAELLGMPFLAEALVGDQPMNRNMLRTWKVAVREGDLATCRSMYAALVDTAEPQIVVRLSEQLEALAGQKEKSFREQFAACVRDGDYDGAMGVGREILRLMPDRLIAEEYHQLEAHVFRRRAESEARRKLPLRLAHRFTH